MNRNLVSLLSLSIIALLLGFFLLTSSREPQTNITKVHFFDIGQGDSIFVETAHGKQMLIDGGKNSQVLMELSDVMPLDDKTIDVVIATHPDADHIGGLTPVLSRYDVGLFLTSDVDTDSEILKDLKKVLLENKVSSYFVRGGMNIMLDTDVEFEIMFPDRETKNWETNTASVVGKLNIGETSVMLTGDSPASIEKYLVDSNLDIDVDILKLGHHGSKTSSSIEFIKATSPKLVIISAGKDNRYGHPAPEVMKIIRNLGIQEMSTISSGTIGLQTDGRRWALMK